jgi:hypothetical protein
MSFSIRFGEAPRAYVVIKPGIKVPMSENIVSASPLQRQNKLECLSVAKFFRVRPEAYCWKAPGLAQKYYTFPHNIPQATKTYFTTVDATK